jgi:hypothetical protein
MKPVGAGNRMHRLVWRSPPPRGPPGGGAQRPRRGEQRPRRGEQRPLISYPFGCLWQSGLTLSTLPFIKFPKEILWLRKFYE